MPTLCLAHSQGAQPGLWGSLKAQLEVLRLGCSFHTPLKMVLLLGKMESKAAFIE